MCAASSERVGLEGERELRGTSSSRCWYWSVAVSLIHEASEEEDDELNGSRERVSGGREMDVERDLV
jgi:hypothetical protein